MKNINWETQADIVMERISIQERFDRRSMFMAAAAGFIIISLVTLLSYNYYQGAQKAQYAKNNAQQNSSIAYVIGYYDVIDYSNIY